MTDDDWVKAAMADDSIVGVLLLHLNNRSLHAQKPNTPALPLDWSVRQRRSRTLILPVNKRIPTRASPTTPLSWSGATSGSGGGGTVDGFEDSSRSHTKRSSALSRSKFLQVIGTSEATSSKRPRKKKTLAELKVEEDFLKKERKFLNRKLESMRVTLEKQRTENESLKRIKRELPLQSEGKIVTAVASLSDKTNPENTTQIVTECNISIAVPKPLQSRSPMQSLKEVVNKMDSYVLPDLNVAVEEEFS